MISHNPDNDVCTGGIPHQRKATTNDSKTNDAQHPLVHLLLQWRRPLLGKGSQHHLIYVG